MNKTKIEWCDYTINPVKGLCPMACKDKQGKEYCYARRMYKRFGWNPDIRWSSRAVDQLAEIKEPSRIFIGSTIELFGDWIKYWWLKTIFDMCLLRPQHTFIFLTKKPENLIKWSPFPENCWVGVSVTNADMAFDAINCLDDVQANVRFLSFEPLLASRNLVQFNVRLKQSINWVIIGQQTPVKASTTPKIELLMANEPTTQNSRITGISDHRLNQLEDRRARLKRRPNKEEP